MSERLEEMPRVVVGPVIGKTTETTSRVLLEVDADSEVTVTLTGPGGDAGDSHQAMKQMYAGRPRIFKFENLAPGTRYDLRVEGVSNANDRFGRVTTIDPAAESLRLVVCSCDKPKNRGPVDMFGKLFEEYVEPGLVDVIVRNGDQVYADHAYDEAKDILKDNSLTLEEQEERILEAYRRIYRFTWGNDDFVGTRRVISHCQQLMMWDDHEVRNDWGTFSQDKDSTSRDYKIACLARIVFWEYQRSLWDDLNDPNSTKDSGLETHMHKWGKFGLIMVDTRGSRSFAYTEDDEGLLIGGAQFEMVRESLSVQGMFNDVEALAVVHSQPSVYLSGCPSQWVGCCPCMTDKMGLGLAPVEQEEYLCLLEEWKRGGESRDLILMGGDLHFAIETDIFDETGDRTIRQVISSAIANKPPPSFMSCLLRTFCMSGCCNSTGTSHTFTHRSKTYDQNFCVVTLRPGDVDYNLVYRSKYQ